MDQNTQQSFEQLNRRAVAVVVDPIQSVKGKVVLDAFRLFNKQLLIMGHPPRQTTSNIGHLKQPTTRQLMHGLNRSYYSIAAAYRKNEYELKMLMNLTKKKLKKICPSPALKKWKKRKQTKKTVGCMDYE